MENNDDKKSAINDKDESQNTPFVNEECGDTMWDQVLKEADERLKKSLEKNEDNTPAMKSHDDK